MTLFSSLIVRVGVTENDNFQALRNSGIVRTFGNLKTADEPMIFQE